MDVLAGRTLLVLMTVSVPGDPKHVQVAILPVTALRYHLWEAYGEGEAERLRGRGCKRMLPALSQPSNHTCRSSHTGDTVMISLIEQSV